jgi:hypothetical protein
MWQPAEDGHTSAAPTGNWHCERAVGHLGALIGALGDPFSFLSIGR